MRLSHVNVTMPAGGEAVARAFYGGLLGLSEIPKPEQLRAGGGVWFELAGGDLHVSIDTCRNGADVRRHFGLECADLEAVRARLANSGCAIDVGRPAPWKRFFVLDPFGNRIEIHEPGGMRQ